MAMVNSSEGQPVNARHMWGLASLDDPVRIRTAQEERLIAWLNADATFTPFEVHCCDCPSRTYFDSSALVARKQRLGVGPQVLPGRLATD